tara:strand:+ start:467 stop:682 length:216 start_codon:yes stop_codon:yes gene_type:complete
MNNEQLKTFIALADELEPENLYEDGEISGDEAIQKERRLLSQWKTLENEVGRRVTVEEIQKTWINELENNS